MTGFLHYPTALTQSALVGADVTHLGDHVSFQVMIAQGYLSVNQCNEPD